MQNLIKHLESRSNGFDLKAITNWKGDKADYNSCYKINEEVLEKADHILVV